MTTRLFEIIGPVRSLELKVHTESLHDALNYLENEARNADIDQAKLLWTAWDILDTVNDTYLDNIEE